MEYLILKLYQEAKKTCQDVDQGFDKFELKIKKISIACLIVMSVSCIEILVNMLLFKRQLWYFIGIIFILVALFVFWVMDNKNKKSHMDKYVNSHKKKIEILESVLETEFGIKTEKKLNELINLYQECVDKKEEEKKRCNSIIFKILSVFAGFLTISFTNMGLIGLDFENWVYLAIALFVYVVLVSICIGIYSYTYFNPLKRNYEMMIKNLKELLLIKY